MSVAQLHADPEELRVVLKFRITSYNEAIDQLEARKPAINPGAFGQGFADHGASVASAVHRVHDRTIHRLQARVNQFEEILRVLDDVETVDAATAAELSRYV